MTHSDILITMDTSGTSIASLLSNYLTNHTYTVTHNSDDSHWVWIPIITPSERRRLVDWFELMQNEMVIIIPILLQDVPCPTAFEARFKVEIADESDDLQAAFDNLKDHLLKARHLLDKLNQLEAHHQDLQIELKNSAKQLNLLRYLDDLKQQINLTRKALRSPQGIQEDNQYAILSGIHTSLHTNAQLRQCEGDSSHIFGHPPQNSDSLLKGRDTEIASICNHLINENRRLKIVSVVGQAGVGKTNIACHVLDLLSKYRRETKFLYLDGKEASPLCILGQLFEITGEAFGDSLRDLLMGVWQNKKMLLETRIDYLIDQYVDAPCLLVLDNLDESLTSDGHWINEEIAQFIYQFLSREHQAKILMTSRIPPIWNDEFLTMTELVPLSMGLCEVRARKFLHDLDADGILGLRDADTMTLATIFKHTKGYVRALEALAGILVNRPLMSVDELLTLDHCLDDDSLVLEWVDRAEEVLDADQGMVMQALAIFVAPVDEAAIRYLLDPHLERTGIDISFTLERLQRGRYITRNKLEGTISLHPLDKDYNYALTKNDKPDLSRMSAGERFFREMNILPPSSDESSEDIFTGLTLEKRAAEYYAYLRGEWGDWQTIDDLQLYLLEYGHRLQSLDYETSFTMLITSYNLLKLLGFARKIVEMILPLIDYLSESYQVTCYNMLGMAYDDLGDYKNALNCHLSALPLARTEDNLPAEAAHLSGCGLQYNNLGEYDKAIEHYMLALDIARTTENRQQERSVLNNVAVVYNSIGYKIEGLTTYEESLAIAREIDDKQGMAVTLANIGDCYGALGNIDKTIECYQESIELYVTVGDKLGRGITIGKMGNAASMLGSYDDALKLLELALDIAKNIDNRLWVVLHKADIAAVYAQHGDTEKGLGLLEKIIPEAEVLGTPIVMNYVHSVLAMLYLSSGQLVRACFASEIAIQHTNPSNQHYEYALYGLIQVRLENIQAARDAFYTSLDHAAELLANTPNLYSPKYSRGLALMGLALVTSDMSYVDDAKQAYTEARINCNAKGIVNREMKKLNMLTWGRDDSGHSNFLDLS